MIKLIVSHCLMEHVVFSFPGWLFLFMEGCLLVVVWEMTVSGLTGRTEGDLAMTCSLRQKRFNDAERSFMSGVGLVSNSRRQNFRLLKKPEIHSSPLKVHY